MKKQFLTVMLFVLLFSFTVKADEEISKMTGIKDHEYKIKPYSVSDSTGETIYMIPLRETCEALGFDVHWNGKGNISVSKGMFKATLTVGQDNYKNRYGDQIKLYLSPNMKDGVTYVPHIFFYYVLDLDVFYLNDNLYFRYKIDDIMPKVYNKYIYEINKVNEKDDEGNIKKVSKKAVPVKSNYIVYPYIENQKHSFVNKKLETYIKETFSEYDYDRLYVKYDIGIYDKNFLSVIFDGFLEKGKTKRKIFNSINFDLKKGTVLSPDDFIKVSWKDREKIVNKLKESYKRGQFMFGDLNMYLMKDAVIFFVPEADPTPMEYYKNYEINDMLSEEYKKRF